MTPNRHPPRLFVQNQNPRRSGGPASSPFCLPTSHTVSICVKVHILHGFTMVVCSDCPRPGTPSAFFSGSPRTKTRAGPAGQHQVLLTCRLDRSSSYVSRSLSRPVSRPVCEGTQLGSTPKQGRCAVLACHRSKQDPLGAGSPRRKVCAKLKPAQHKHPQKLPPVVVRNQSDTPAGGSLYHPSPRPCASCVSAPWFIDTVSRALTIAYPSCGASWLSRHAR